VASRAAHPPKFPTPESTAELIANPEKYGAVREFERGEPVGVVSEKIRQNLELRNLLRQGFTLAEALPAEERERKMAELNALRKEYVSRTQYVHVAQSVLSVRPSQLVNSFARDLIRFPHEDFEELCSSVETMGVIEPIMIRVIPPPEGTKDALFEVICGHARRDALKKLGKGEEPIEVLVKNWDDATVLKAMKATQHEFNGRTIELVRATVLAYAEGRIDLGPIPEGTPESEIRYAPSFITGDKPR
jgi:hypothetical protein